MIDAKDLRIGNWIKDRGGKQWQIDCWEHPNKVAAKSPHIGELFGKPIYGHPLTEDVEYLQPIPLTPEILEKCGFVKEESNNRFGWYISIGKRDLCWCYSDCVSMEFKIGQLDEFGDTIKDINCQYLHELQNLYWCLCKEELQYKP